MAECGDVHETSQSETETEMMNCWDWDEMNTFKKRLETVWRERDISHRNISDGHYIPDTEVLMKFLYFTILLPKINKATSWSQSCFIKSLLDEIKTFKQTSRDCLDTETLVTETTDTQYWSVDEVSVFYYIATQNK